MPHLDADAQLGFEKLLELGILDVAGLKRFAEFIKTVWAVAAPPRRRAPSKGPGRPAKLAAVGAEVLLAALRTKPLKEVAKDHGVNRNTVRSRLRQLGISDEVGAGRPGRPKILTLSEPELREVYRTRTMKEIARAHGVSRETVRSRLRELGIWSEHDAKKGRRPREELKLSDDELRAVAATKSTKEIAAANGVRPATVLARLRLLGLKAPRTRRLSASPEELRELYRTKSAEEIARAYGVTTGTARKRLSELRIEKPGRRIFAMGEADLSAAYAERSAEEIAAEHGVAPGTVRLRLMQFGIRKPRASLVTKEKFEAVGAQEPAAEIPPSPASTAQAAATDAKSARSAWHALTTDDLRRLYGEKTAGEIARAFGVSPVTVSIRMAKEGIKKPAGARFRPENRAWLGLSEEDLRRAYAERTAAEIASDYGISPSAVANRMARLGIKKRRTVGAAEETGAAPNPPPSVEGNGGGDAGRERPEAVSSPSQRPVALVVNETDKDAGGVWFMPENYEPRQPRASESGNGNGSPAESGSNGRKRNGKHGPASRGAARAGPAPAVATSAAAQGPLAEWLAFGRDDLRRLYAEKTSREIAQRYGVSAKSVRRRMARLGMGKAGGSGE